MSTNNALNNTAVTQSPGDNTTNVATTAFVTNAVSGAGGGSPGIVGPPFYIFNLCGLPGMLGAATSNNIVQSIDYNGTINLIPFYVSGAITTTIFEVMVAVGLAASTCTVGVYASVSMQPSGAPLGAVSMPTTSVGTQTAFLLLP